MQFTVPLGVYNSIHAVTPYNLLSCSHAELNYISLISGVSHVMQIPGALDIY